MNKKKKEEEKYFNYQLGDTVCLRYKLHPASKKFKFGKGMVTREFIMKSMHMGRGFFGNVKDFSVCKTTFSFNVGNGTKNFDKKFLVSCRALLLERV